MLAPANNLHILTERYAILLCSKVYQEGDMRQPSRCRVRYTCLEVNPWALSEGVLCISLVHLVAVPPPLRFMINSSKPCYWSKNVATKVPCVSSVESLHNELAALPPLLQVVASSLSQRNDWNTVT